MGMELSGHFAQEIPDIKTDRPDRTESASTVPSRLFQIESGFEFLKEKYDDDSELDSYNIGNSLFRYGLFEDFELRFAGGFLSENLTSSGNESNSSGIAGFMAGIKYSFINDHQSIPDVALLLQAYLPIGSKALNPGQVEPEVILSAAYSLTEFLDISSNIGIYYRSSNEKMFYFFSFSAGFGITEKLGSFVEIYSELFPESSPFYLFNVGFTYLILSNLQLDVSGGDGLFNNSEVWYLGIGISFRIPR